MDVMVARKYRNRRREPRRQGPGYGMTDVARRSHNEGPRPHCLGHSTLDLHDLGKSLFAKTCWCLVCLAMLARNGIHAIAWHMRAPVDLRHAVFGITVARG